MTTTTTRPLFADVLREDAGYYGLTEYERLKAHLSYRAKEGQYFMRICRKTDKDFMLLDYNKIRADLYEDGFVVSVLGDIITISWF